MSLKQALRDLDGKVEDLMSLHVQTYAGTVAFRQEGSQGRFDNLRAQLATGKGPDNTDLDVELKLETLVQFDGDSYNFVAKDNVPEELFKLHRDALDSGLKTRLGLLEMMKNLFQ